MHTEPERLNDSHWGMRSLIQLRSLACGVGVGAVAVIVLAGCGSSAPTVTQLRETVRRYLSATTTVERCQLLTTAYRTENPDVVLSGGCQQDQQASAAEEAARRTLRIARIDVHGDHATVALAPARRTAVDREGGVPHLIGLQLETEHGQWRIDGFTETAQGMVTITSPPNRGEPPPRPGRPSRFAHADRPGCLARTALTVTATDNVGEHTRTLATRRSSRERASGRHVCAAGSCHRKRACHRLLIRGRHGDGHRDQRRRTALRAAQAAFSIITSGEVTP